MQKEPLIKKKKIQKSIKLINQIQHIRSKNNKNWMDLVKLSLSLDFNKTSKILSEIYKYDNKEYSNRIRPWRW